MGRIKAVDRCKAVQQKRKTAQKKLDRKADWEKKVSDGELEVWDRDAMMKRIESYQTVQCFIWI